MNANLQVLFAKQRAGELTMNQAYKQWSNAGGNGSLKDFIGKAQQNGYVDQGLNAASAFLHTKFDPTNPYVQPLVTNTPCDTGYIKDARGICMPAKKPVSTFVIVSVAVLLVGLIGGVIYLEHKKGNK